MPKYTITWSSRNLLSTSNYEAKTVGEAIDQALEIGLKNYHWPPSYLEIKIFGASNGNTQKKVLL